MALIITDGTSTKQRALPVTKAKALEIKQKLLDMPGDLSEDQYDFLKSIEYIRFGDGSRFPELNTPPAAGYVNATYYKQTQGMMAAAGDN